MSNTQANIMLKPNLCMQNSKIDPKMGKLIPTLETWNFSVLVCKIDNIFLQHLGGDFMKNFSPS